MLVSTENESSVGSVCGTSFSASCGPGPGGVAGRFGQRSWKLEGNVRGSDAHHDQSGTSGTIQSAKGTYCIWLQFGGYTRSSILRDSWLRDRDGNQIRFVFEYPDGAFHNTIVGMLRKTAGNGWWGRKTKTENGFRSLTSDQGRKPAGAMTENMNQTRKRGFLLASPYLRR